MGKRILLIEPSRIIRNILGVHLQLAEHTVFVFATYGLAREALRAFQNRPPALAHLHVSSAAHCSARCLE